MDQENFIKEQLLESEKRVLKGVESFFNGFNFQKRKQYLKSQELRKMLGNISASKLQEMRVNGILPYIRVGGMLLYEYDEVIELLNKYKNL